MFPLDEILPVMENIPQIKKAVFTPKVMGEAPAPRPAIFHPFPWYMIPHISKPECRSILNHRFLTDLSKMLSLDETAAIDAFCKSEEFRILAAPFLSDIYGTFAGDSRVLSEFEKQQILGKEILHSLMNQFSSGILPLLLNSTPPDRNEMFLQTPPPLTPIRTPITPLPRTPLSNSEFRQVPPLQSIFSPPPLQAIFSPSPEPLNLSIHPPLPIPISPLPKTPLPNSEVSQHSLDSRVTPPHLRALFSPSPAPIISNSNSHDCCASPHVSLTPAHTPVSPFPETPFPISEIQQFEQQRSIFSPSPDCNYDMLNTPSRLFPIPALVSPFPKTPLPITEIQQSELMRPIALNLSLFPIASDLSSQQHKRNDKSSDIPQSTDTSTCNFERPQSPSLLIDYVPSSIPSIPSQSAQFSLVNHELEYDATAYDLSHLIIPQSHRSSTESTESSAPVEKIDELASLLTSNISENNDDDDFSFGSFYADLFGSSDSQQQQQQHSPVSADTRPQLSSSDDVHLLSTASTSTATPACIGFQQSSELAPSAADALDMSSHQLHQLQTQQEQQQQQVQLLFEQHQQQIQELKRVHQEQQQQLQELQQYEVLNFHQSSAIVFHPLQQEQHSHSQESTANQQTHQHQATESSLASATVSSQLPLQAADNASSSLSSVNVKYFLNGSVVNYTSSVFQPTVNIIIDKHDLIPSVDQVFENRRSALREKRERAKWIKIIKREKRLYWKELYHKRKSAYLEKLSEFTKLTETVVGSDDIWGDSDAYSSESEDENEIRKRRAKCVKSNNFVWQCTREERGLSDAAWVKQKHCVLTHYAPITKISSLGISIFITTLDYTHRKLVRHWTKSRLEKEATEFLKKYNCDLLSSLNTLAIRLSVDFHLMVFTRELELLAKSKSKIHNVLCVVRGHHGFYYPVTNYIGLFNQRRREPVNEEKEQSIK